MNGPNLNLLGLREPEIYGYTTLNDINQMLVELGHQLQLSVETFQSNHEGILIDKIQEALNQSVKVIILNAGGFTHTSVALRDAVAAVRHLCPTIEVHISNTAARESFRHNSYLAGVVAGRIEGFGPMGYTLALRAAQNILKAQQETAKHT